MTRPPHAASSVVGYASDTASAVAKVEPNSNRSRETGRPYGSTHMIVTDDKHVDLSKIHVSVAQIETIMTRIDSSTVQQNVAQIQWSARQDPSDFAGLIMA